jgi:CubicO group peptidase (beta-lactamase class C family)
MEDPDVGWSYSGEGFEYLRHAMEKLTGRSLEDLAKDYVFKPAGMSHTTYIWNDWVAQNYAGEYYRMGEPLTYSRPSTPNAAASLITTVGDYANFGIWVMNGAGLSKGLQREMVAAQKGPPFGLLQGLGWVVTHDAAGRLILNHGGSQTGIRAQVLLSPETKSGLVIFTNGSNGTPIIRAVLNSTMNKHGGLGQIDRMLPQWGSGGL